MGLQSSGTPALCAALVALREPQKEAILHEVRELVLELEGQVDHFNF